jgi:hypothetical protein
MINYTGFTDKKGVPICENDLIKIYHFKHRNGRKIYMYDRVVNADGKYLLIPNSKMGIVGIESRHKLLMHSKMPFAEMEVIDGDCFCHPLDKAVVYWIERKLKRNIFLFKGAN